MKKLLAIVVALVPSTLLSQENPYYSDPIPIFTSNDGTVVRGAAAQSQVGDPSDFFRLLKAPAVLGDLELFAEQREKLLTQIMPLFNDFQLKNSQLKREWDGSPVMIEKAKELNRKYWEDLWNVSKDILVPFQLDRLKQIHFQAELCSGGTNALQAGELSEMMELTEIQKKRLREKTAKADEKLIREIYELRRKRHREVVEDVLTKEQLKLLDESLGKPMADVSK